MTNVHPLITDQSLPTAHLTQSDANRFEKYLGLIFQGHSKINAARGCGIADQAIMRWISEAETDEFVIARRRQLAASVAPAKVWTRLESLLALKSIAIDETQSPRARISAIAELNLMAGFTEPEKADPSAKRKVSAREYLDSLKARALPK